MPFQTDQAPRYPAAVEIVIRQKCHYKEHGCKVCGLAKTNPVHKKTGGDHRFAKTMGCAHCGQPKKHRDHFGVPVSLNSNVLRNPHAFATQKAQWSELLLELLEDSGLPKGLDAVAVSCSLTFPNDKGRDEGNLRFLLEKALGDVLVRGGWIPDDTFFPVRRYTFGQLEAKMEAGVSETRLTIWPD